jgi:hypothetical protein
MAEVVQAHGVEHSKVQTKMMDFLMEEAKKDYLNQPPHFKQLV